MPLFIDAYQIGENDWCLDRKEKLHDISKIGIIDQ
jgi:hypothetical protein